MNQPSGPTLRVTCPQCRSKNTVTAAQVGQQVTCDFCLEDFTARVAEDSAAADRSDDARHEAVDDDLPLAVPPDENQPEAVAPESPRDRPPGHGEPASGRRADDQWLKLDDDLTDSSPSVTPARKPVLAEDYEFSFQCPLCSTRQSATDDQIGSRVRCPDCHSEFEIRTPPPRARQRRTSPRGQPPDEFRLSEPIERPRYEPLERSRAAERETGREQPPGQPRAGPAPDRSLRSPGLDALRKAEEEFEAREREAVAVPKNPLFSGFAELLIDPALLTRWLLIAAALQVESAAIREAQRRFVIDEFVSQLFCLMLVIFSLIFGLMAFATAAAVWLAIVQESAAGKRRVEAWPGANFGEWIYESFFVASALLGSLLAGMLLGQAFRPFGAATYAWGLAVAILLTSGTLFPVVMLGMLETGSPLNPFSRMVLRSLTGATRFWFQFYVLSLVLIVVGAVGWQLARWESLVPRYLAAAVVVGVGILYARLLGRLALGCQEALSEADEEGPAGAGEADE